MAAKLRINKNLTVGYVGKGGVLSLSTIGDNIVGLCVHRLYRCKIYSLWFWCVAVYLKIKIKDEE